MDPVHTAFLHTIVTGSQFTDEFGKVPELDFVETPVGMIYVATRRVGDNVWARMVETCCPTCSRWRRSGRTATGSIPSAVR